MNTTSTIKVHTEHTLETAIVDSLVSAGGYIQVGPDKFDKPSALCPELIIQFLQASQPKEWERAEKIHKEKTATQLLSRLQKELDLNGSLHVLRKGFTDLGVHFDMAYFKPESTLNATLQQQYDNNILAVMRQVKYSQKNENSLDLVLFLNGIPVATAELKNQFTGQTVEHAKRQYKYDRDNSEPIFRYKQRALVHFVVDTDLVFYTTKLNGSKTFYLPFNRGFNTGAGNPPNAGGNRTSYLWEYIWAKDSWMDILGKFLHWQITETTVNGNTVRKEDLIFPRYHQVDAVRALTLHAKLNGAGHNYLIQHSAGSGKSNSIAWLAYRLSNLHNSADEKIFQSTIVVTDRRVLDHQLQNTIYQFEHKLGVVQKIDKNSAQLAEALEKGTSIIITTLQKFPMIVDTIGSLPGRRYAVIVDEAHSSQSGQASQKMKQVLSVNTLEAAEDQESYEVEEENYEDVIRKKIESHGRKENLSFFAFTATPKPKTLAVFGVPDQDGKPKPFHLYAMRQAIEEGFIMDVLKNYTTYKTYFRLNKKIEDDPNIPKKKGAVAVARFLSLHPHNLAQKTEVIVEHFRSHTRHKIGGLAKAMVVTSSRLHAVRYKEAFDQYIKDKGYTDLKSLIAFSGKVAVTGKEYTEVQMNGFGERELPDKFSTPEYHVLIVAEKYQTGFDQPLLHTMYVDKRLGGVKAVQTLSRLNRMHPGKEDTFILDFVNDMADIVEAFQPYYQMTQLQNTADPNHVYDLKTRLEKAGVFWMNEVESFCRVYFSKDFKPADQGKLNAFIDPAVERFKALPKEKADSINTDENTQENFRGTIQSLVRFYSFITQIVSFGDLEIEKLYTYSRLLVRKLPPEETDRFQLKGDEVALEYYRLQKIAESNAELQKEDGELDGGIEAGLKVSKEERTPLSEVIKNINNRFNTEFKDADRLMIEQVIEDCMQDQELVQQAKNNSIDNFKFPFDDKILGMWIDRMGYNQEFFKNMMDNNTIQNVVNNFVMNEVYRRISSGNQL
jgi:type I restriction enzyme, R subunit